MRLFGLPDYQPLPPVGEPDDLFDTRCSRCDRMFVEEEVDPDSLLCVNCQDEEKILVKRNTGRLRHLELPETGDTL